MAGADRSVDVVIPVYNEEHVLAESVATLTGFLTEHLDRAWQVVIADNASVDGTLAVAERLAAADPRVRVVHLDQKGRGRALRKAWLESRADVVSYMDVDLSTNLAAFPPLVDAILEHGYDIAIGSRLKAGARVTRQWKREIISRIYNLIVKAMFPRRTFSDAQCGFKAVSRPAAQAVVPLVEDQAWFFDSELLLRAEELGFRVAEVPVEWIEDLDSRVHIASTAFEDLKGLARVRLHPVSAGARAAALDQAREARSA
jgi:glycosyltransferase involved in cell wall biosynthesis